MLNDVIFNDEKSAYDDWNITLIKADIPLPEPKLSTVDIKGADGLLDLSEVIAGDVKYNNRTVKLSFEMMNDDDYYTLISKIGNYLHGKNITFKLTNDEDYFYTGRATINSWECVNRLGKITITIDCDPFKYDVIESIYTVKLNGNSQTVTLPNKRKRVCPVIDVNGVVNLIINGVTYKLQPGEQQLFNLTEGDNVVRFSGDGTVKITYRQGAL